MWSRERRESVTDQSKVLSAKTCTSSTAAHAHVASLSCARRSTAARFSGASQYSRDSTMWKLWKRKGGRSSACVCVEGGRLWVVWTDFAWRNLSREVRCIAERTGKGRRQSHCKQKTQQKVENNKRGHLRCERGCLLCSCVRREGRKGKQVAGEEEKTTGKKTPPSIIFTYRNRLHQSHPPPRPRDGGARAPPR